MKQIRNWNEQHYIREKNIQKYVMERIEKYRDKEINCMNDTLKNYVEIEAEKAESLSFCRGLKLLHVRDQVEEILAHIGKVGLFEEYTVHNISHIDEMLGIIEWLIPDDTKKVMTSAEWLMLTLAVYFHDLGMVITKDEYEKRE
jgi:hypothetical protein